MKNRMNKIRLGLLIGLCALLTGAAAQASGRPGWTALRERLGLSKPVTPPATPVSPNPATPARQVPAPGDKVLVIYLNANTIEPSEIRTTAGPTQIFIRNNTGSDRLGVTFTSQDGNIRQSVPLKASRRSGMRVNLPLGTFLVTDPEDPNRLCRIIVE